MRLPILALTAAAATASAATVSYNGTGTDFAGNAAFTSFTLLKFDNTQGALLGATLTGVTITVNSLTYGGSFTAQALDANGTVNSATGSIFLRGDPNASLGFTQIDSTGNPLTLSPSAPFLISAGDTQTFAITPITPFSAASSNIDTSFFSAYIGTGSVIYQVRASNPSVNGSTTGDLVYDRNLVSGFADVTVTYTYTPVPEPSTYGMILGGLALAGAALRRRQKAAK